MHDHFIHIQGKTLPPSTTLSEGYYIAHLPKMPFLCLKDPCQLCNITAHRAMFLSCYSNNLRHTVILESIFTFSKPIYLKLPSSKETFSVSGLLVLLKFA